MKEVIVLFKEPSGKPFIITGSKKVAAMLAQKDTSLRPIDCLFMNARDDKEYITLNQPSEDSFDKKKKLLRSWYKKYKVGMVKWSQIPVDQQELLRKYYGVLE